MSRIAVVGDWHNAFVTAAGLAELGHEVVLTHTSPLESGPMSSVIAAGEWKARRRLDIHEPGLDDVMTKMEASGGLRHVHLDDGIDSDGHSKTNFPPIAWLAIDTPVGDDDGPDVLPLVRAIEKIVTHWNRDDVGLTDTRPLLIVSSQVPIGFCEGAAQHFGIRVAYVPENLRLGRALEGWRHPDRVVIGAASEETRRSVVQVFQGNHPDAPWDKIVMCGLSTAEMIKHATNTFLATSISLANELAKLGEMYGVDNQLVAKALKMDSRIGKQAYVRPGMGFAGGTLPRDIRAMHGALVAKDATRLVGDEMPLTAAVLDVNSNVTRDIVRTVQGMHCQHVVILGYTYKAETNALRRSPARQIIEEYCMSHASTQQAFMRERERMYGYDPRMDLMSDDDIERAVGLLPDHHLHVWGKPSHDSAPVVYVVVTPLPAFRSLNWNGMQGIVFDLCEGIDKAAVLRAGMQYKAIWQPVEQPEVAVKESERE